MHVNASRPLPAQPPVEGDSLDVPLKIKAVPSREFTTSCFEFSPVHLNADLLESEQDDVAVMLRRQRDEPFAEDATEFCNMRDPTRSITAQVQYEHTGCGESAPNVLVELYGVLCGCNPGMITGVGEDHILIATRFRDVGRAVGMNHPKSLIVLWDAELVPQRDDVGVYFDCRDCRQRQSAVAELGERAAAQTEQQDAPRRPIEEEECHHRARVGEGQPIRLLEAHHALGAVDIEIQKPLGSTLHDERLFIRAIAHTLPERFRATALRFE